MPGSSAHSIASSIPRPPDLRRRRRRPPPQDVSVFFSDIVGFTDLSREMEAEEVVDMLDRLYQAFDSINERYGLFKIDVIGDAYMCAPAPHSRFSLRGGGDAH